MPAGETAPAEPNFYNVGGETMKKRILSLLMTLAMLLTIIPVAGITALAANAAPDATEVAVNDNKLFGLPNKLHFKNGDTDSFTGNETDYNAHYDPTTGTLTLKDYEGARIAVGGSGNTAKDITIKLIGNNTVIGNIANNTGGDITITGSGSLTVNRTESTGHAYGIAAGFDGTKTTGNVTIKDSARVTIDSTYSGTDAKQVHGIFAQQSITISDSASVVITCSAPHSTVSSDAKYYGLYATGKVAIDTTGNINIKVTDVGTEGAGSYGVYALNQHYTLTKVGSMTVEWKGSSGKAIYGTGTFNENTHAVNVDTTNCYASYRYGTPYQVEAVNGTLSGPGVKENVDKNIGNFLAGDEVKLTADELKVGEVTIPFTKWVSNDVSITNATSETATITVPAKNVTVTAQYNPCTVAPKFEYKGYYSGSNRYYGDITFTLVAKDSSTFPRLYSENNLAEEKTIDYTINENTYTGTIYSNNVPAGQYVIGVKYGNVMCYSEPFTVNYSATQIPATGISLNKTAITLTLNENATETLTATVTPDGSTDTVSWESSNTAVATVNTNGKVTAKAAGTATITATAGSQSATCTVTVKNKQIAVPTAVTGLVYTGSEQQGVPDGEGYSLTGHKATNANTYTATATLGSGYEWSDGTTAAKQITWKIDQADPTYSVPTGLTGTKGSKLSSVTLPANWSWMDQNTEMSETGNKTFPAKYTPTDNNYKAVTNVDVTVVVSEAAPTTYTITVTNGKAYANTTGGAITEATAGTTVTLTADTPESGKTFDKWEVVSGSVAFDNGKNIDGATFTMPAGAVSVKATYKDTPHTTHVYDQETVKPEALKTAADCTNDAVYFKSCTCGAVNTGDGADTFTKAGTALGHDYTERILDGAHKKSTAADCTSCDTYWYDCSRCDKNAKDDAAATDKWFTSEDKGPHDFARDWSHDDEMHWHKCSRCDAKQGVANHNFGDDNICDICDYDKSVPHEHSYGSVWQSDDTQHWHECSCNARTDIAAHTESNWIIDTPATATGYGTKHKECTVCGRRMQDARIEPTGSGSGTITIIVPSTEEPTKPADQKNPSTGAAPGSIGYDTLIGLAAAGALCIGAIKLVKKDED